MTERDRHVTAIHTVLHLRPGPVRHTDTRRLCSEKQLRAELDSAISAHVSGSCKTVACLRESLKKVWALWNQRRNLFPRRPISEIQTPMICHVG